MKNLNGIIFITIFSLLTTGCMPESLTKFKKDTVQNATADVTFTDEDGNVIDGSTIITPTSFNYPDNQVIFERENKNFIQGLSTSTSVEVEGDIGDIGSQVGITNLSPVFSISPSLPTGLSIDSETGEITSSSDSELLSLYPNTTHTVTLTFLNPSTLLRESISTIVNVAVQEPINEAFRVTFGDNATTQKMYLQLSSEVDAFSISGSVSANRSSSETSALGTVRLVNTDTNTIVIDVSSGEFKLGDSIDNSSTYSGEEGVVESLGYYFQTNSGSTDNIHLAPLSNSASNLSNSDNGVSYTISPDLPSGLSFDTTTGEITGRSATAVTSATYTIRATNDADSTGQSTAFNLAIVDAPQLLSYNSSMVLKLDSTSGISIGDYVATNFSPPLTSGGTGIVQFISGDFIVVKVTNGGFEKDQSLDINRTYVDEETTIVDDPELVNGALTVSSTTGLTDYKTAEETAIICNGTSARATIMEIDTANNVLFISESTDSTYSGNFVDNGSNTITNTTTCGSVAIGSSSGITIQNVWSQVVNLNVASASGFLIGQDVHDSSSFTAAGIVGNVDGSSISLTMVTKDQFDNGNNLTNDATGGTDTTTISSVSTNNKIEVRRGEKTLIQPFLILGSENYFTISPELPDGLSLDSSTGEISGTPTEATPNVTFTVTATNTISTYQSSFDIEVVDYFEVLDNLNGPSYVMHKEGILNKTRPCRINKKAIENFYSDSSDAQKYNVVDIDCFLEVGESDLFNLGLDLQVDSGPDVCEFVQYYPYSYWQFRPHTSSSTPIQGVILSDSCTADSADNTGKTISLSVDPQTVGDFEDVSPATINAWTTSSWNPTNLCAAQYIDSYDGSPEAISCDFGNRAYYEITLAEGTSSGCNVSVVEKTVDCGGERAKCLGGAIKQEYNDTGLNSGFKRTTTAADDGLVLNYQYSSPLSLGYNSNISLANFVANNSCEQSTYEYSSHGWYERSSSYTGDSIEDPMIGESPFYTFNCVDSASELKARIRVMVREWDYVFDKSYVIDEISPANMDRHETTDTDSFNNPLNEFKDFDDLLYFSALKATRSANSYGSCAGETATGATAATADSVTVTSVNVDSIVGIPLITLGASAENFTSFTTSPAGVTTLLPGMNIAFDGNTYTVSSVLSSNQVLLTSPALTNSTNAAMSLSVSMRFPFNYYK